ncbi:hypothetical protein HanIR_Chr15g0781151 [Helianthus annuus]|nr:hypothetical protein HanIR_Chr15g0781151 [Helianthus annuus]
MVDLVKLTFKHIYKPTKDVNKTNKDIVLYHYKIQTKYRHKCTNTRQTSLPTVSHAFLKKTDENPSGPGALLSPMSNIAFLISSFETSLTIN